MAESQAPYTYIADGVHIRSALSDTRFHPYLVKAGYSADYAFNLYLFNARLSKAFLFPLHILEVTLRNKISSILSFSYSTNWHLNPAFRILLSPESLSALDIGIHRANETDKTRIATVHDVISTLAFDFWSNLFRPEYDRTLWQTNMPTLLPHAPLTTRRDFQKEIKDINHFRNRIAHHEPIHKLDITKFHSRILRVLESISDDTYKWVHHHSTVNTIVRTKPSATGEPKPHYDERCDRNFSLIKKSESLADIPKADFLICINDDDSIFAVIDKKHIAEYLLNLSVSSELIIDLKDHTYFNVIEFNNAKNNFTICSSTESFMKSKSILKRKINYIVVRNENTFLGVVAKAHREY